MCMCVCVYVWRTRHSASVYNIVHFPVQPFACVSSQSLSFSFSLPPSAQQYSTLLVNTCILILYAACSFSLFRCFTCFHIKTDFTNYRVTGVFLYVVFYYYAIINFCVCVCFSFSLSPCLSFVFSFLLFTSFSFHNISLLFLR